MAGSSGRVSMMGRVEPVGRRFNPGSDLPRLADQNRPAVADDDV